MSIKEQLQRQAQFFHPEKKYGFLRGGFSSAAHAALFGLREQFYLSMKAVFTQQVNQAAADLIEDPAYRDAILALPLKPGSKIVALGDSLTDDSQSWFEIIRRSFELVRPDDQIQFHNLAVSGDTTTQLLGTVIPAAELQADLYLCFSGTNDARQQGGSRYKPCTSLNEIDNNLTSLFDFAQHETTAPWVWITPIGVDGQRAAEHDFLKPLKACWDNTYIHQIADLMVKRAKHSIDLRDAFGDINDSTLIDADGLHWSLSGNQLAAQVIVGCLGDCLAID